LHLCVVLVLLFVLGGCRSASVARTITPSATLGPSPTVGLDPIAQPTAMVGPSPTPSPPPTSTVTPTPTPPPAPAFVASHPIAGDQAVPPTGPLLLVFDQPMDCAAVASALVISPTVEGRFDCPHPEQVLFAPTAWADNTAYTVVLGTGARSAAGQVLTAPVKISFATGGAGAPIPIIMYHALLELDDDATPTQLEWTTSPQNFAAQMEYLAQAGYTTVDFEDLLAYLEQAQPLPPKPVLITFDDGHYTFRTQAWPALKALDFRVTLFVVADYAAYQGYLSWEQIAELAGEGVTIGSHSLNHAALTKVDADEVLRQVGDSKSQIEKHAGETVHLFSYPYGAYDDAVIAALIQTGYRAACTINPSFYQHRGDNYSLNRIHPTYNDTLDDFIARLP
ncbi:MAG: polysaccharide deacetylase family protein, partial [Chloroflexota bacterium]|nr:polysaccharide deacetylase family protein [Chloroflexota bacterium]